jgi:hypothetical protein
MVSPHNWLVPLVALTLAQLAEDGARRRGMAWPSMTGQTRADDLRGDRAGSTRR